MRVLARALREPLSPGDERGEHRQATVTSRSRQSAGVGISGDPRYGGIAPFGGWRACIAGG